MNKPREATPRKTATGAILPDIGDGEEFGFFFTAPATHHLYYLLPYIRATKHRSVMVYSASTVYVNTLCRTFPDIKFFVCRSDDLTAARNFLDNYKILMFSNGYPWFSEGVQSDLNPQTLLMRVSHGSSHKFADDAGYYTGNMYAWDGMVVQGPKDVDLFYEIYKQPKDKRSYGDMIHTTRSQMGPFVIVQSGCLRLKQFLKHSPSPEKIRQTFSFLDPKKKTILVMPTHPTNAQRTKNTYSGLSFFIELFEAMDNVEAYNFLFKLHPNLVEEPELLNTLKQICQRKNVLLNYGFLTSDYLPMMSLADVLIADRTSAVMEFMHFDKPIVFLDNTQECPPEIAWDDLRNPFWTYRNGPVISPDTRDQFENILAAVLINDNFHQVRKKSFKYAFASGGTPQQIMASLLFHPKVAHGVKE